MKLRFILPSYEFKGAVEDFRRDFLERDESGDGTAGLLEEKTFDAWLERTVQNRDDKTVQDGLVPATVFLVFDEDRGFDELIGMINIRHRLNENLERFGGHVGYSVRYTYRNQGYATEMLGKACAWCFDRGIKRVLVTCSADNIGSKKVIEKNGGVLESETLHEGAPLLRYWIEEGGTRRSAGSADGGTAGGSAASSVGNNAVDAVDNGTASSGTASGN